jgi:hypothetical protein
MRVTSRTGESTSRQSTISRRYGVTPNRVEAGSGVTAGGRYRFCSAHSLGFSATTRVRQDSKRSASHSRSRRARGSFLGLGAEDTNGGLFHPLQLTRDQLGHGALGFLHGGAALRQSVDATRNCLRRVAQ